MSMQTVVPFGNNLGKFRHSGRSDTVFLPIRDDFRRHITRLTTFISSVASSSKESFTTDSKACSKFGRQASGLSFIIALNVRLRWLLRRLQREHETIVHDDENVRDGLFFVFPILLRIARECGLSGTKISPTWDSQSRVLRQSLCIDSSWS